MVPSFFATRVQQDRITLFLYMSEIENYNLRIERNLEENKRRWRLLKLSITLLLFLPVFLGIVFGIIQWLR
jgi:hypothetical protein